jgi:pimeloyl-ACP methyl ester carboxylesterase
MISGRARAGAIELAYDVFGDRGEPLVLVMGIGAQRIFWDLELCEQLVAAGFRVVRFDHRDLGESTRLDAPVPRPFPLIARRLANLSIDAPYTLSDMAADVIGLLDHLAIDRAHVVGASLGGMIGQHLAIEHPSRLASLTAIMTTPGGRRFLPEPFALRAMFGPQPRTAEEAGRTVAQLFATIGSPLWPIDADRLRAIGEAAHAKGPSPRGFLRQFAAMQASGDRSAKLVDVRVPTLVIHGTRDPLIPIAAGRALAHLIPNATWLPIAGMGHDLPPHLWPVYVAAIRRHAHSVTSTS